VVYWLWDIRCPSCIALENYTKSEVEADFADAIRDGKIEWKIKNSGQFYWNDIMQINQKDEQERH
jgi:hypothetical protein